MTLIMIEEKRCFRNLIFTGIILITGLFSNPIQAQDQTSSPYSRFGVGDLLGRNYGRGQAMGGLGIGLNNSQHLNLVNPAGLGGIFDRQFILEVGGSDKMTWFSTKDQRKTTNNIGFSYLGMGFPVTKWWQGSFGIQPYSGVGYSMFDTKDDPIIGKVQSQFDGKGGISQFFISQSITPFQTDDRSFYISLGVNFSYLFGPITHSKSLVFPADSSYFSTQSLSTAIIGDIHMNYGVQARIPIKEKWFLTLGGIYEHQSNINAESRKLVYISGQGIVDTLFYNENQDDHIVLPQAYGAGFSFGKTNVFTFGADFKMQNWKNASYLGESDNLANSQELIVGAEFIPDLFSPMSYFKRMEYRAGVRYGNTYLQLNETQLKELGINFGVGLPIRGERGGRTSSLNIAAEIGKRGTIENDLIAEFYGLISVQLTLRDTWFRKYKYD